MQYNKPSPLSEFKFTNTTTTTKLLLDKSNYEQTLLDLLFNLLMRLSCLYSHNHYLQMLDVLVIIKTSGNVVLLDKFEILLEKI